MFYRNKPSVKVSRRISVGNPDEDNLDPSSDKENAHKRESSRVKMGGKDFEVRALIIKIRI